MKPYYSEAGITIYHGDCREILPSLTKVDLVLTDPPYGIQVIQRTYRNVKSRPGRALAHKTFYDTSHEWDDSPPTAPVIELVCAAGNSQIIWGGNYFTLPPSPCWLVWDKDNGDNDFADCELAWTNMDHAVRKFKWTWNGMIQQDMGNKEVRQHPTQKPLALMKWCITQAGNGVATILDPFMGSGTTLRAAKDLGLKAIGIEVSERYCLIAVERLRQQTLAFEHEESREPSTQEGLFANAS